MKDLDKVDFHELMIGAGETFGKDITKPLLRIYFNSLEKFTIEQVTIAISKHLQDPKHGSYFPKPADLIRQMVVPGPSVQDRAELGWMSVVNAISSIGSYGNLKLEDKQALAAVRNLGSWKGLCQTDMKNMDFKKREFMAAYQALENTPLDLLPNHLPGIEEMHNQRLEGKTKTKTLLEGLEQYRLEHEKGADC